MSTEEEIGLENLRIEVEVPKEGLANLVPNPSGDLGAWGWTTPVAGTALYTRTFGPSIGFEFSSTNTVSTPTYLRTDHIAILPSQFVAGRYDVPAVSSPAGYRWNARLEFWDADRNLISTGPGTATVSTVSTFYIPAAQAPTTAAFVTLRLDFLNSSFANPTAPFAAYFRQVMVVTSPTSDGFGVVRTNLVPNPSFEVNTTGWTGGGPSGTVATTVARVNGVGGSVGSWVMRATASASGDLGFSTTNDISIPVIGGQDYDFSALVRPQTPTLTTRNVRMGVWWYENGVYLTSHWYSKDVSTGTFTRIGRTAPATAPSNATHARIYFISYGVAANEVLYVDGVLLEASSASGNAYFDGSTVQSGATHVWTGTAHNSASRATTASGTYAYNEGHDWANILGPTHEININRFALDTGTLTAQVLDANLDPSVSEVIQPGKKIRLQTLAEDNTWHNLFVGKMTNANVSYDLKGKKRLSDRGAVRIDLSATDAIADLANQGASSGVADIWDLSHVLEGKGVPFRINGSGHQMAFPTIVSHNENASALDQIYVTRDSVHGTAYITKDNIFEAWSESMHPARNIVFNPSFESGITGWFGTDVASSSVVTEDSHTGTRCFKGVTLAEINSTGGVAALGGTSGAATLPSTDYFCSSYMKGEAGSQAWLYWNEYDAAGTHLGNTLLGQVEVDGTWQQIKGVAKTKPETRYTRLFVLYRNRNRANEVFYIDSFSMNAYRGILNENSYSGLNVDYNMEACINSVIVKWLRYDIGNDSTEEITYPAIQDPRSVRRWGARSATFTIGGNAADETPAKIQAFANKVLSANAVPRRRINSVTCAVMTRSHITSRGLLDVGMAVRVSNDVANISEVSLISGVEHTIKAEAKKATWSVTYRFDAPDSVASPTFVPSPPFTGSEGTSAPFAQIGATAAQSTASASAVQTQFNTNVEATPQSMADAANNRLVVPKDGVYLITLQVVFAAHATGYREARINVGGTIAGYIKAVPQSATPIQVTALRRVTAGQFITATTVQNSGGALNIESARYLNAVWMSD